MDLGLSGRVALIVGGSGLIGRATGRVLADEGATVVLAARASERLDEAVAELGADRLPFDARDEAQIAQAVVDVFERYGRLDALIVTSAPSAYTLDPARDREAAHILDAVDGKALSFLRVAEAFAPRMAAAGYGRIVGLSGQNARITKSVTGAVRNQALITIAKILADTYAGTGVTVNVVNPGPVTESATHAAPRPANPGDSTPEEVATLVAFLASPAAGAVSGESIAIGHKLVGVAG